MGLAIQVQRLRNHVRVRRLLLAMSLLVAAFVLLQCYGIYRKKLLLMSPNDKSYTSKSRLTITRGVDAAVNDSSISNLEEETRKTESGEINTSLRIYREESVPNEFPVENLSRRESVTRNDERVDHSSRYGPEKKREVSKSDANLQDGKDQRRGDLNSPPTVSEEISMNDEVDLDAEVRSSTDASNSSIGNVQLATRTQTENSVSAIVHNGLVFLNNKSAQISFPEMNKRGLAPVSLSQMNSILEKSYASSQLKKGKKFSARDRELLDAKLQIDNAPSIRASPELCAAAFKNISVFQRSYELMERKLKVYVYREGTKPVFHQPYLRGIYASEGWFMKLLEGNKEFTVRDPRKAHLFYLPFSSLKVRSALDGQKFRNTKELQDYLGNYVKLISEKYPFWNRSGGADHFLVACHDWAPHLSSRLKTCIRALCNANAVKNFKIGMDTTLPVTYIKTSADPQLNIGGKRPSERSFLAFFAGGMHGYLRPILLQYWENKEPEMKIFGQLPRSDEGKSKYREYMKSSKYCICAKGYEVHTPRVVEAIFYECVPVIISDNYVPPFFEVLNWEAFAVFIPEKDIPNLRNILLSIPEEKYLEMQSKVKMVQQHFLWHKKPVRFDLFHMILHSVWYNRVFQIRNR